MIDKFSNAIKDGNVYACCLYCYLELDNGLNEIEYAMTKFEQSEDANILKKAFMPIWRTRNVKLRKQLTRI